MTISSFEDAERHLDRAWYAALIAATIDGVLGAMVILGTREFTLAAVASVGRVVLTLLLAYAVAQRSRLAAVVLLLLGILRIGTDASVSAFARLLVGLPFVYFYARGVQAAFAYHRLRSASLTALRVPIVVLLLGSLALGRSAVAQTISPTVTWGVSFGPTVHSLPRGHLAWVGPAATASLHWSVASRLTVTFEGLATRFARSVDHIHAPCPTPEPCHEPTGAVTIGGLVGGLPIASRPAVPCAMLSHDREPARRQEEP
ncbi:MAG: hypothetical protein ACT4PJ_03065 [Gemmatimonadaceae bacterium]